MRDDTAFIDRQLLVSGQIHRLRVHSARHGWETSEEINGTVCRRTLRDDWHRVERDCALFDLLAIPVMPLSLVSCLPDI